MAALEREHSHEIQYLVSMRACSVTSIISFFVTPWIVACQATLSMGFPRQEHWRELPCLPPGDLPNPGIKPSSPVAPVLASRWISLPAEPSGKPRVLYLSVNSDLWAKRNVLERKKKKKKRKYGRREGTDRKFFLYVYLSSKKLHSINCKQSISLKMTKPFSVKR